MGFIDYDISMWIGRLAGQLQMRRGVRAHAVHILVVTQLLFMTA